MESSRTRLTRSVTRKKEKACKAVEESNYGRWAAGEPIWKRRQYNTYLHTLCRVTPQSKRALIPQCQQRNKRETCLAFGGPALVGLREVRPRAAPGAGPTALDRWAAAAEAVRFLDVMVGDPGNPSHPPRPGQMQQLKRRRRWRAQHILQILSPI